MSTPGTDSSATSPAETPAPTSEPPFLAPVFQPVLEKHVLPQLKVKDLGRLSTTCRTLHTWLAEVSPATWRAAAARNLPHLLSRLQGADVRGVLRTLQHNHAVMQNLEAGRITHKVHVRRTTCPAFSPSRDRFAALKDAQQEDTCLLCVFDSTGGQQIKSICLPFLAEHASSMAFLPNEQEMTVVTEGDDDDQPLQWHLVDLTAGSCRTYAWPNAGYREMSLSSNGQFLGALEGKCWQIWDVLTGKLLKVPDLVFGELQWSNCGRYMAGHCRQANKDGFCIYDFSTGNLTGVQDCHFLQFSPNSLAIACFSTTRGLKIHSFEDGIINSDGAHVLGTYITEYVSFVADNAVFGVQVDQWIHFGRVKPGQWFFRTPLQASTTFLGLAPAGGFYATMTTAGIQVHKLLGDSVVRVCASGLAPDGDSHHAAYLYHELHHKLGWTRCSLLAATPALDVELDLCLFSFAPE